MQYPNLTATHSSPLIRSPLTANAAHSAPAHHSQLNSSSLTFFAHPSPLTAHCFCREPKFPITVYTLAVEKIVDSDI